MNEKKSCLHLVAKTLLKIIIIRWSLILGFIFFCDKNDKKYVLIDTDHIDFDFETYPHLLKFDDSEFTKLKFVLQREISVKNDSLRKKTAGTLLFEYTD